MFDIFALPVTEMINELSKKKLINLINRLFLAMRTTQTKHKLNVLKFE